jgi:hypothetical protein
VPKIEAHDFGLLPLDQEPIPNVPPAPQLHVGEEAIPAESRQRILDQIRIPAYLSYDLLTEAFRLSEISRKYEGGYRKGHMVPTSSRAAATGTIAIACAAIEAYINDLVILADIAETEGIEAPAGRLLRIVVNLPLEKRIDAIFSLCDVVVDWSREPFQSVSLLFSVRKHLLHHEGRLFDATKGFWPAKKLQEVAKRIQSPYRMKAEIPIAWYDHILTPGGAEWAVDVMAAFIAEIENMQSVLEGKLGLEEGSGPLRREYDEFVTGPDPATEDV